MFTGFLNELRICEQKMKSFDQTFSKVCGVRCAEPLVGGLEGCGCPVDIFAAGNSTDRADRRDKPFNIP